MPNEVRIEVTADAAKADRVIGNVSRRFEDVGKKMALGVTLPIVAVGAVAVKMGADFQTAMNQVRAVSGATGKDFIALSNQAKELGRTTQFSASQAAEGMGFLAMAGFSANEIIGAMPTTLQLAAAGQLELAQAADIASNILTGYRMTTEELEQANNVLVKTFTSTNTNLVQLGEALKFAAPVAASARLQFEEVSAAIGLLGNAGIQATMAGTALRGGIAHLLNPTKEASDVIQRLGMTVLDADGNLVSLESIVQQLGDSGATTADMLEIFGQRAGPGMSALVGQGADALRDLTEELMDSGGVAQRIAAVQMEGFNGAMRRMRSALEGAAIAFVQSGLLDKLAALMQQVGKIAERIAKLPTPVLGATLAIAGFAAALGPLMLLIGQFLVVVPKLIIALRALRTASLAAMGPWGLVLGGALAVGGYFGLKGLQHGGGLPEGVSMVGEAGPELAVKRGGKVDIIPAGKVPGFQGGTAGEIAGGIVWEALINRLRNVILPALRGMPPEWLFRTEPTGAQRIANQGLADRLAQAPPVSDAGPGIIRHDVIGTYYAWKRATEGITDTVKEAATETVSWDDALSGFHDQLGGLNDEFAIAAFQAGNVGDVLIPMQQAAEEAATAQARLNDQIHLAARTGFDYQGMVDSLTRSLGDAGLATQVAGASLQEHLTASITDMAEQLPGGAAILTAMTDAGMSLEEQFRMLYDATGGLPEVLNATSEALKKLRDEQMAGIRETVAALPSVINVGTPVPGQVTAFGALAAGGGPLHNARGEIVRASDVFQFAQTGLPMIGGTFGKSQLAEQGVTVAINGDVYGMEDFVDKVVEAVVIGKAAGASA